VRRRHDEAVAASGREHLLHVVGELLRTPDDGAVRLPAAAEVYEVPRARIGFAAALEHAVADAKHARHPLQFGGGERVVDALGREIEVERLGKQR